MKKLLFATATVLMMSTSVFANGTSKIIGESIKSSQCSDIGRDKDGDALEKIKVVIHLKFGRASMKCERFGICEADVDINFLKREFIGTTNDQGQFVLEITEEGLQSIEKYFGGQVLILEEDFALPLDLTKKLGLKTGYKLKTGKYTIQKGKEFSSITF